MCTGIFLARSHQFFPMLGETLHFSLPGHPSPFLGWAEEQRQGGAW